MVCDCLLWFHGDSIFEAQACNWILLVSLRRTRFCLTGGLLGVKQSCENNSVSFMLHLCASLRDLFHLTIVWFCHLLQVGNVWIYYLVKAIITFMNELLFIIFWVTAAYLNTAVSELWRLIYFRRAARELDQILPHCSTLWTAKWSIKWKYGFI